MTRDLLMENLRVAAERGEPVTLSPAEAATTHGEYVRLVAELGECRAVVARLRGES